MSIYQLGERLVPVIDPTAFVFENATIIGLVELRALVNVGSDQGGAGGDRAGAR